MAKMLPRLPAPMRTVRVWKDFLRFMPRAKPHYFVCEAARSHGRNGIDDILRPWWEIQPRRIPLARAAAPLL